MYRGSNHRITTRNQQRRINPQIPCLVQSDVVLKKPISNVQHQFIVPDNNPAPVQGRLGSSQFERSGSSSNFNRRSFGTKPLPSLKNAPANSSIKPPLPQADAAATGPFLERCDHDIDVFLKMAAEKELTIAIESFFQGKFSATHVCFWRDIPTLQLLFSQSRNISMRRDVGIAGSSFISRQIIKAPNASLHPSFDGATDGAICSQSGPVLVFPLWDNNGAIIGIVEIFRSASAPLFVQEDEMFCDYFIKKFKLFSKWLLASSKIDPILFDIMQIMSLDQFLATFQSAIAPQFQCRSCEIWKYNKENNEIFRFDSEKTLIKREHAGIVGELFNRNQMCNIQLNKFASSFDPEADGHENEAVLALPIIEATGNFIYVITLRGPKKNSIFTSADENELKKIGPFLVLALSNAESHTQFYDEFQRTRVEQEGMTALLEVAEILSSMLDLEKLVSTIMEKGRSLTNADRCSLFLVNEAGDRLITSFQRGLDDSIDIPINKGIAGKTVSEAKILNIADAYDDPSFDPSTDIESGYRTRSILSIPIYNYRGDIIGVTEMVNKLDQKPFSSWDAKVIQIFNVFCGISLENARLYRESLDMSQQLHSFFEISLSLSKSENIQLLLSDIMQNARKVVGAQRASLFLVDQAANVLKSFIADGGDVPATLPLSTGIAAACAQSKEPYVVNDVYHDPRFNRQVDSNTGFKTKSVVVVPVIGSEGVILGVAEMINKSSGSFSDADVKMLQSFATFTSVALENNRLKDIAELGTKEVELHKYIGESEVDNTTDVPILLQLTEEQKPKIAILNFFAMEWSDIDRIKILFNLYHGFGLPKEFHISNGKLFRFFYEIRSTYHNVPYHNWIHACDVSQYVSYETRTAGLDKIFTKFEILGLLTSAICHDAGHDGFNNIYNVKAETPLGILYKDQSVMETHHCNVAINILSKDEFNMFIDFSADELKKMWTLIIKLILATDMAHHFQLIKKTTEILDANEFSYDIDEHRLLTLQLILKVGDISNVSRPFTLADKWCDVLNQEFFRQGDHEKEQGFGLTSPLNDREHPDKPKSQIGFYNFVCMPLYQAIARICPPLEVNLNSVKANLEVWKSMMPPPPPAEEKK